MEFHDLGHRLLDQLGALVPAPCPLWYVGKHDAMHPAHSTQHRVWHRVPHGAHMLDPMCCVQHWIQPMHHGEHTPYANLVTHAKQALWLVYSVCNTWA